MLTTRASAAVLPALKSSIRRSADTGENSLLFAPHARMGTRSSAWMIVAEYVKASVHDQAKHLFASAYLLASRVIARYLGANIHISDDSSARTEATQSKGYDVGRPAVPEVASVETRDRGAADEGYREHGILYALGVHRRFSCFSDQCARDAQATNAGRNVNRKSARRTLHSSSPRPRVRRPSPRHTP